MSEEQVTHSIDLIEGAKNPNGAPHRHVVFGRRITGADLFRLDALPQSEVNTQYQDLTIAEAITEFGSIEVVDKKGKRKGVPLNKLLELDAIDRDDLAAGYNEFMRLSQGDREPVLIGFDKVKLAFGFPIGGEVYDFVQFGNRLTGYDEVAADKLKLEGVARLCYLAGKQISKIAKTCPECGGSGEPPEGGTSNGGTPNKCAKCAGAGYLAGTEIEGTVELEQFRALDGVDISLIRGGADLWRQSFRLGRGKLSENKDGAHGAAAGDENRVDGRAASGNAGGAA